MRMRLALVLAAPLALVAGPAFAQVDPCLNDPVACVGEVVDEVSDTVEETADEVSDTVDEAVEDVEETVDDVVASSGSGEPAAGGGPGDDGRNGPANRGSAEESGASERDRGGGADAPAASVATRTAGERQRELPTAPPLGEPPPQPGVLDRISNALTDAAAALTFPVALLLVVASFMLVQSRIDRDDPKLSLAPVDATDEALSFG